MIPILYPPAEMAFRTNGIGLLTDAVDVTVQEELNGIFELEMVYPVSGIHFKDITGRCIILSSVDPIRQPQPFRVYRITKPMNGRVKVYARHIAYDTQGIPVRPFTATGAALALQGLKDFSSTSCPFNFYTDKAAEGTMTVPVPTPIWSQLGGKRGSVLDVFGGEYLFDRYDIYLLTRRGADNGVSIRYGKNLTDFQQDENCANCCTGLYPYWTDSDGNLVELPERIVEAPGTYDYTRILPMDFSGEWDTAPTEEQLRTRTEKYIADNDVGIPDISWSVSFVQLEQTEEYKGMALLERVQLGDTVHVGFTEMNVSASARAVATRYKPLLDGFEKVTLGKVKSNLASTVVKQGKEIAEKPTLNTILKAAESAMNALLGAKGGSLRQLDTDNDGIADTLYIADNPDPALAQKVWRWNYIGWAASKNGYNGPFTMAATLEEGLLADFVTAAHLTAGTIKSSDGTFFLDLNTGTIRIQPLDTTNAALSDLNTELTTSITQLKSNTQNSLSALDSSLSGINADLQAKYNNIAKYFSFDVNGLTIGAANNPNKVVIDNDEISILVNGIVVQKFDSEGRALIPELRVTRRFEMLDYVEERDDLGNVNCIYIGEEA